MESNNLNDKLIRVERTVNIYAKKGSEPLEEINIDTISFSMLKEIVAPEKDDPLLYDGYDLDANQLDKINKLIDGKIKPNHKLYNYILVCGGIYNW